MRLEITRNNWLINWIIKKNPQTLLNRCIIVATVKWLLHIIFDYLKKCNAVVIISHEQQFIFETVITNLHFNKHYTSQLYQLWIMVTLGTVI